MRCLTLLAAAALVAPFAMARGQTLPVGDLADERAFVALRFTHIGALAPLMTPAMVSRRRSGAQIGIRYAVREQDSLPTNSYALAGTLALGFQSSISATVGVNDAECDGCTPALMVGAGGDVRLYEAGDRERGSSLTIAVSADIGYGDLNPTSESAFAAGVGLPLTVSFGATPNGFRVAPYFTPMFGFGSTTGECAVGFEDCDKSGTLAVLGGGIGVWKPGGFVSASIGFSQVVLDGAAPVFGVNVMMGGSGR